MSTNNQRRFRMRNRSRWVDADPYDNPTPKLCARCSVELPRSAFAKNLGAKDGLRGHCIACEAVRIAASRDQNRMRWGEQDPYDNPAAKRCQICRADRPRTDFYRCTRLKDGLSPRCISCTQNMSRTRRYKLSPGEYERQRYLQGDRCAIPSCGIDLTTTNREPNVDHDHKTGVVRGLICTNCNMTIGNARDNVGILIDVAIYLAQGGVWGRE